MSTYLFNFLLTKYQILSLGEEEFLTLYHQGGKDDFENFFSWVSILATEESSFFLLQEDAIEKVLSYFSYYRSEYNCSPEVIDQINGVIGIFNCLQLLPEKEQMRLKEMELISELRIRGYKDMSYCRDVNISFLYQNDVNNLSWLLEGDFDHLLENPLLTDTIHYMCSIDHFFDEEKELLQNVSKVLHMAEGRVPNRIPLTRMEKYQYKRLIKSELKYMRKLGLEEKK